MNYRQCKLQKYTENGGFLEQTSWIPEPYCVKNAVVRLKDEKGSWSDGWKVVECSASKEASWVEKRARDYLKHRETTDI